MTQTDELTKSDFLFQKFEAKIPRLLLVHGGPWNREVIPIWGLRNLFEVMPKLIRKRQTEKNGAKTDMSKDGIS